MRFVEGFQRGTLGTIETIIEIFSHIDLVVGWILGYVTILAFSILLAYLCARLTKAIARWMDRGVKIRKKKQKPGLVCKGVGENPSPVGSILQPPARGEDNCSTTGGVE